MPGWAEAHEVNGRAGFRVMEETQCGRELKTYVKSWHFYGKECGEIAGEVCKWKFRK